MTDPTNKDFKGYTKEQIPDCHNPNCDNKAMILYSNSWYCGHCIAESQRLVSEQRKKFIEENVGEKKT